MTKQKNTKRALLMSALALLVCVSMLVGSTFAWFTDSVSNGVNKIVSGNLDIALYHNSNYSFAEHEEVKPETALFVNANGDEMLWEPGAESIEDFLIKNEGSLALKYQLKLEVSNATETPEGKTLADILDVCAIAFGPGYTDPTYLPVNSVMVEGSLKDEGFVLSGYLLPGEYIRFGTYISWEPSDVDNEYNVKGGLSMDLGVTLLATQYTYENDAWGDQYDKDATYPDISDQLASGGYLKLTEDSQLTTPIVLNDYAELDLNGYNLILDNGGNANGVDDDVVLSDGANLTIKNGTLTSAADGDNKAFLVTNTKDGTTTTLNLENVELNLASPSYDNETSNSIFASAEAGNVVVNINEGTTIVAKSEHHAPVVVGKNATVNMYDGSVIDLTNVDATAGWTCVWGVLLEDDSSVFNMYGGVIDVKGAHSASGIYAYGPAPTVNIYGGTINVETSSGYGIGVEVYNGTVNATGGTFNIKATAGSAAYAFEETSNLSLTVTEGVIINVYNNIWSGNTAFESGNANPTGCDAIISVIKEATTVNTVEDLKQALEEAKDGDMIQLGTDVVGNLEIEQSLNTAVVIDGNGHTFTGSLLVDGKSGTYTSAGLVIQNINFVADSMADLEDDACIMLGKSGDSSTRYTCNVTIKNCTFDVAGAVGVKSYTGGDKNLTIIDCTATARAHSLAQLKGIDGVLVKDCTVNSVRGISFNNSNNVVVEHSTFDVEKYAVRFGDDANTTVENYEIIDSTIASDNVDDDAAIVLRAGATNANLTLTNTTITAGIEMSGHENANLVIQ